MAGGGGPGEDAAQQRVEAAGGGAAGQAGVAGELGGGGVEHRGEGRGLAARGVRGVEAGGEAVDAALGLAAAAGPERGAAGEPGAQDVAGVLAVEVDDERVDAREVVGRGVVGGVWGGALGVEDLCEALDAGGVREQGALVEGAEAAKVAWRRADGRQPGGHGEELEVVAGAGDERGGEPAGLVAGLEAGAQGREGRSAGAAGREQGEGVADPRLREQDRALGGAHDGAGQPLEVAEPTLKLLDRVVGLGHRCAASYRRGMTHARPPDHADRLARARVSLDGLSVGDAFGERFFGPSEQVEGWIAAKRLPEPPWSYTDDTEMALSIVEALQQRGAIDPDALALAFARRYQRDPQRGYGGTAHEILRAIGDGAPWQQAAGEAFGGQGSMGNGGAMRSGPIGGYFADDLARVVAEARASAFPTHAHPDGQAGAIAVAVAAAMAWRTRARPDGAALLAAAVEHTPDGPTREGLVRAARFRREGMSLRSAARLLGSGYGVISSDTVPFALLCASLHLGDFAAAMWATVAGLGDRDTTCAIAGGVVALSGAPIPAEWLAAREPLTF